MEELKRLQREIRDNVDVERYIEKRIKVLESRNSFKLKADVVSGKEEV